MTQYNKLVRDKIPEILDKKNIPYEKRIANEEEYKEELIKKLVEESNEFAEAKTEEELADVLEVVLALKNLDEFSNLEITRQKKVEERGAFNNRFILKGEK